MSIYSKRYKTFNEVLIYLIAYYDYKKRIVRLHVVYPNASLSQLKGHAVKKEALLSTKESLKLSKRAWNVLNPKEKLSMGKSLEVLSEVRRNRKSFSQASKERGLSINTELEHTNAYKKIGNKWMPANYTSLFYFINSNFNDLSASYINGFYPMAKETPQNSKSDRTGGYDVFISYSKDKDKAFQLCKSIESNNIKCWIAPRNTSGIVPFAGDIIGAIDQSQLLVLVLSNNSNSSPMVLREIAYAVANNIPIIIYKIEKTSLLDEMKFYIGPLHQIDATSQTLESALEKLIQAINTILEQNKQKEKSSTALKTITPKSTKCSVIGRVTTTVGGKVGIGNTYVALVNADHPKHVCYEMVTDAYGFYHFQNIDINGQYGYYQIYANKVPYGDSYSDQFILEERKVTTVDVEITTKPTRIELRGEKGIFHNDGTYSVDDSNFTIVDAYVYDALGNSVADGCHVIFYLLNPSTDAGKLESTTAKISNAYMAGAFTEDGIAKVKYLWAKNSSSCKIQACCIADLSVYATLELKNRRRRIL